MRFLGLKILYDATNNEKPVEPANGHVRAAFDLVAVHGLNGDAFTTWTHGTTGKLWLRDMLPPMLPATRIITYGYNANFINFTSTQNLYNISAKLLSELSDFRRTDEERKRPIVFVCHSLGGIVVKKALTIKPTDPLQKAVQNATHGVVFMGTPHQGSNLATLGKTISDIAKVFTPLNPANRLLGSLRKGSDVLLELSRDFAQNLQTLTIITFYEMDKTEFILTRKVVVDTNSAVLRLPNEVAIGQNANHRDITKFADSSDMNYRPVLTKLLELGENISRLILGATQEICSPSEPKDPETERLISSELPIPENFVFRGMEVHLDAIEEFFSNPPRQTSNPLVYVITGLGGAGKTQIAAQYALLHKDRYPEAIFFITASSLPATTASIDRHLNLLKVLNWKATGGEDKIRDFHEWLKRHKKWLLIFDGADDLKELNFSRLLPKGAAGHVLVTTRDGFAINQISGHGTQVESLEPEAAKQALFDKAKMRSPSKDAVTRAGRITEMLGYLPLAIGQAGAYITARQKTLAEYEALLSKRSKALMGDRPRMAASERTIQAAWQVNFDQLEDTSPDAVSLLLLFAFLEPSEIVVDMLKRGCAGKEVWGQDGQAQLVSATDVGIDADLVDLVTEEFRFEAAVDELVSYSLVRRSRTLEGHSAIALHPLVQLYSAQRATLVKERHWQEQAILLICQAFPYNDYLAPGIFGDQGRQMFAHVPKILRVFDDAWSEMQPARTLRHALVIMLLSGSKFNAREYKKEMVQRAKDLLANDDNLDLRSWHAARESTLMRICGENDRSYGILQDHIHGLSVSGREERSPITPLTNGLRGELVLSYASNLLLDGNIAQATEELEAWQPLDRDRPSRLEKETARQKHVTLGRTLRNQGKFAQALEHFEELLKDARDDPDFITSAWQAQTFSHVSDLYCEVGKPQRTLNLLQRELDHIHDKQREKTPRAAVLQLCQVEALIRQGDLQLATARLLELDEAFSEIAEPDMLTTTRHFRVHACLARISHMRGLWDEAQVRWHKTYAFLDRHGWTADSKTTGRSFNEAITLFSLAQVLWRLEQHDEAHDYYAKAQDCLRKDGRKYWLVALGSYWFEYVVVPLGETGPDPVVRESTSYLSELAHRVPAIAWESHDGSFSSSRSGLGMGQQRLAIERGPSR